MMQQVVTATTNDNSTQRRRGAEGGRGSDNGAKLLRPRRTATVFLPRMTLMPRMCNGHDFLFLPRKAPAFAEASEGRRKCYGHGDESRAVIWSAATRRRFDMSRSDGYAVRRLTDH